jgi:hypothetical protein
MTVNYYTAVLFAAPTVGTMEEINMSIYNVRDLLTQ